MARFTEEQVRMLKENKNVLQVSEYMITFTPEFHEYVYSEKQKGKRLREIFAEAGLDPEMLGEKRMRNLSTRVNNQAREESGFVDKRYKNGKRAVEDSKLSLEEQNRIMRHEIEYLKQELEFIKKIQLANAAARKEWESKHRRG